MKLYFLVQRNIPPFLFTYLIIYVSYTYITYMYMPWSERLSTSNSYVEALISNVIVFAGGAFEK